MGATHNLCNANGSVTSLLGWTRMKRWIRRRLAAAGYVVFNTNSPRHYARDSLFTTNSDHFREDPLFQAAYARGVAAGNGVDPHHEWRVHVALWAAQAARRVPGDFVECGVNAGFVSSAIMQRLDWARVDKRFFLIDSFQGPVASQFSKAEIDAGRLGVVEEAMAAGGYITDLERVRTNFAEWPNANVVQGVVPDVLATLDIAQAAFVHIDMNCVYPEQAALAFFWERMAPGGIILFDDYVYFGNRQLTEAIDQATRRLGAQILSLPTGQGLILK
jgi:hypothetical protein